MTDPKALLEVNTLTMEINGQRLLDQISLRINPGETVGLVGESGSGKSLTAKAILGMLPGASGEVCFLGRNLLACQEKERVSVRGNGIAMICQNPMTSLNPTRTIGVQLMEGVIHHKGLSKAAARSKAADLLRWVGMSSPEVTLSQYPDQLSGGMKQRAVIAMALMCNPSLLVADEPTTSLDVTTQAQILDLLQRIQKETNMSILLISHDLGVVAGLCDRIYILQKGKVVDTGTAEHIFHESPNAYTRELCWKRL